MLTDSQRLAHDRVLGMRWTCEESKTVWAAMTWEQQDISIDSRTQSRDRPRNTDYSPVGKTEKSRRKELIDKV